MIGYVPIYNFIVVVSHKVHKGERCQDAACKRFEQGCNHLWNQDFYKLCSNPKFDNLCWPVTNVKIICE